MSFSDRCLYTQICIYYIFKTAGHYLNYRKHFLQSQHHNSAHAYQGILDGLKNSMKEKWQLCFHNNSKWSPIVVNPPGNLVNWMQNLYTRLDRLPYFQKSSSLCSMKVWAMFYKTVMVLVSTIPGTTTCQLHQCTAAFSALHQSDP